jgi:ribosome-associated heat shock protein Hsp15
MPSTALHADDTETDIAAPLPGLTERLRLDKWLWAARFHKTRSLAGDDIDKGRIQVNGQVAKASRELKAGDVVDIRQESLTRSVVVKALSTIRGPAPQAQRLYEETAESIQRRAQWQEQRRTAPEPANAIEDGRPTKRDRRKLADWQRWSASTD